MALINQWVTYLDRSYKSIKSSILDRVKVLVPEMTDHSESNLFVIIISAFAGLVEQINYYIDNLARESYITTARRYSSMVALTRLIDYRIRSKVAATTNLKITALDASDNAVNLVNNFTFNSGLIVKDAAGVEFITTSKITMFASTSVVTVGAKQVSQVINNNIGSTNTDPNQSFKLSSNYNHDTLQITINTETWELRQTLAYSGPLDKHFIVEVNESKEAWVLFGDNINGAIPPTGQSVLATYYDTIGLPGNLEVGTLTIWDSAPTPPVQVPAISSFSVTNSISASGGLNEEGIEDIRRHAPLSLRTLDRAVTYNDHKAIAELVPGVAKAAVSLDSRSKTIYIYIVPEGGGTASNALKTLVNDEFLIKGMIGTNVVAKAAGETILRLGLTVTAKFRRDTVETESDIITALINAFGFNNSDVNKKVRSSDIIALIDNLDKVDYLTLDYMTTKPYPRISAGSNSLENNWYINVLENNTQIVKWRLLILAGGATANLYGTPPSGSEYLDGVVTIHATDPGSADYESTDSKISLGVWGTFSGGDEWVFYSYPYNKDIELSDYTLPTIDVDELSITVVEQLIP